MENQNVTIDISKKHQKLEGFGTSLMWWANAMQGFESIPATAAGAASGCRNRYEELMALLFDPDMGLGMNIVRYNVGGGDCRELDFINRSGAKIPGYLNEDGHYDWTADAMQQKVLADACRMITATGQTFYNTVFSVAPPYFMTYSGSSTGSKNATDDNLRWDCYQDFVDYFLNVAAYLHDDLHIPVSDIEPVNEPTSGYWVYGSQKQEGCQFNRVPQPELHQAAFDAAKDAYDPHVYSALSKIYEMTGKELALRQRAGKLSGVTISGTDETSIDEAGPSFLALTDKAKDAISKIATHGYAGSSRKELHELASRYSKKLWMSEASYGDGVWNPEAMDRGCFSLSRAIQKDLYEMGATAWVIWQGIESLGENLLWNANWGLIHCLYEEPAWKEGSPEHPEGNVFGMSRKQYCIGEELFLTPEILKEKGLHRGDYFLGKQYYVFGQYTRFLKEGYEIVSVSGSDVVAAVSPNGTLVIVAANETEEEVLCRVEIQGMKHIASASGTRTSETESWGKITDGMEYGEDWLEVRLAPRSVGTYEVAV